MTAILNVVISVICKLYMVILLVTMRVIHQIDFMMNKTDHWLEY